MRTARDWDPPFDSEPEGSGSFGLPTPRSVTRALLWGLGVIGVLGLLIGDTGLGRAMFGVLSLDPLQWREWAPFFPLWQLATYGLLHSPGDPFHLLMNLLVIYGFGTLFEASFGARRMALWFASSIVFGGLVQLAYSLASGSNAPTLGASGGAMFLVVAMAVLQPDLPVFFLIVRLRLKTLALILVALDVFRLLMALKGSSDNVAFAVHLAGAALGFVAVRRRWVWMDPLAELAERRHARQAAAALDDEKRLDQLLERIHREGIGSLSGRERDFLKRMSARRGGGL